MKKISLFASALCLAYSVNVLAADTGVTSLRNGSLDENAPAETLKDFPKQNDSVTINYVNQPPLIPHSIRDYRIDTRSNKCLSCHSLKNFKAMKATKISTTHFVSRDGEVLSDVSPRRYFCLQCHVPQVDAKPLVGNDFKPAGALAE